METIQSIERKQACDMQHKPVEAKYPTGLVIDLRGPQGNIFYLFGVAKNLLRDLAVPDKEKTEFKREQDAQTSYQGHLDLLRKWFGIVFINNE